MGRNVWDGERSPQNGLLYPASIWKKFANPLDVALFVW